MTSRRNFLKQTAGAIAAVPLIGMSDLDTARKIRNVGIQLFSIPKLVEQDFAGTMKMLAEIGYKEIEFYGPYSFSAEQDKEFWDAVTPSLGFSGSGFFGLTAKEVKTILDDNGDRKSTRLNSSHVKISYAVFCLKKKKEYSQ